MAFYRICPDCGAYLDPGEQCSCHEERLIEMERKEKARVIRLEIGGQGSINVSGSGVSKEKIVDAMMENLRDVFMNIVQQEIIEEGEGAYEF